MVVDKIHTIGYTMVVEADNGTVQFIITIAWNLKGRGDQTIKAGFARVGQGGDLVMGKTWALLSSKSPRWLANMLVLNDVKKESIHRVVKAFRQHFEIL